MKKPAP